MRGGRRRNTPMRYVKITVLFSLLSMCVSLGWGQGRSFKAYKTDDGCSVLMSGDAMFEEPVQWTGRCESGLVSGLGIFSGQFDTRSLGIARWHSKFRFLNGKEHGAGWVVADPLVRQTNDSTFSMRLQVRRDGERLKRTSLWPSDPLDQSLQKAEEFVNEAVRLGLPTMTADELKNDVRQWYQNPSQYTGGGKAAGSAVQRGTDDPKTTGRGVRVG